jgi:parallel beta-helix repeat protein
LNFFEDGKITSLEYNNIIKACKAVELSGNISVGDWYVSTSGDDNNDGRSIHTAFATIQKAIDSASDGQVVVVGAGIYYESIDFNGKSIIITSTYLCDWDAVESTIIDACGLDSVVTFSSGEDSNSFLSGFTITNGNASGIYCSGSSPTIENCVIMNNFSTVGGGINCYSYSEPTIKNCIIQNNSAASYGGGIYAAGSPTIEGCTVKDNTASVGGGIGCTSGTPILNSCYLSGNSATTVGGGIFASSNIAVNNCAIYNNSANYNGGGAYINTNASSLTNCTIVNNIAGYGGDGVRSGGGSPVLTNCIIWGNDNDDVQGSLAITYSCLGEVVAGAGNITGNPEFKDYQNGDYDLTSISPCIDAANGSAATGQDILGRTRKDYREVNNTGTGVPAYVDIGAYEYWY